MLITSLLTACVFPVLYGWSKKMTTTAQIARLFNSEANSYLAATPTHTLATVISLVFNTPFTALYGLLLLVFLWPNAFDPVFVWTGFFIGLLFLLVIPLLPILHSIVVGRTDVFVSDQNKRSSLFAIAITSQILGTGVAYLIGSSILTLFHLCYVTTTTVIAMINVKTKLSVHIAGIAGPVTFLAFFLGPLQLLWWLTIPPVAWSRLKLKAHSIPQLVIGFLTAVMVTASTLFFASPWV